MFVGDGGIERKYGLVYVREMKVLGMQHDEKQMANGDKTLAAVCGLYCEACTLYIASTEDPTRLAFLAERFGMPEEELKCFGCRSHKRGLYCQTCTMFTCAAEKGIDFCVDCDEYPCDHLKQFQSERQHRNELWNDLAQIKEKGWEYWLQNNRAEYACPQCDTINSAYDLKCRKCGHEPSCNYVAKHKEAIEQVLKNM